MALSSVPLTSSTTAMLLTPSSFMSFMASSVVESAAVDMMEVNKFSEGSASRLRGLSKYDCRERTRWACWAKYDSTLRSETMPSHGSEGSSPWIRTGGRVRKTVVFTTENLTNPCGIHRRIFQEEILDWHRAVTSPTRSSPTNL
jgi:hypothetical protein